MSNLLTGTMVDAHNPDWEPLNTMATDDIRDTFMWMYAVELSDGRRLQAYKHYATRRYVHLDAERRAWAYTRSGHYMRVDIADALEQALAPWWERGLGATAADIAASRALIASLRTRRQTAWA